MHRNMIPLNKDWKSFISAICLVQLHGADDKLSSYADQPNWLVDSNYMLCLNNIKVGHTLLMLPLSLCHTLPTLGSYFSISVERGCVSPSSLHDVFAQESQRFSRHGCVLPLIGKQAPYMYREP